MKKHRRKQQTNQLQQENEKTSGENLYLGLIYIKCYSVQHVRCTMCVCVYVCMYWFAFVAQHQLIISENETDILFDIISPSQSQYENECGTLFDIQKESGTQVYTISTQHIRKLMFLIITYMIHNSRRRNFHKCNHFYDDLEFGLNEGEWEKIKEIRQSDQIKMNDPRKIQDSRKING